MNFYSTKNKKQVVGFKEAVKLGLPKDNGLFMPEYIPALTDEFLSNLDSYNLAEIGYTVLQRFVGEEIPNDVLKSICNDAFSFEVPLIKLKENIYSMELYHGPTLAFKDFGARFYGTRSRIF